MNLKILPLKCYDIIVGLDWLEISSPMKVHWSEKWMSFYYQGKKVKLQGVRPILQEVNIISYNQVQMLEEDGEVWCILEVFAAK